MGYFERDILSNLQNRQDQQIKELIERNSPRDASAAIQAMTQGYGPSVMPPLEPLYPQQESVYDYQTLDERRALDPAVQQAFYNAVNPALDPVTGIYPATATAYNTPRIAEDAGWIQVNLSNAQRPMTAMEQLQQRQMQAMQMEAQQAQINAQRAQRELAEAQTRLLREQKADAVYRHNYQRQINASYRIPGYDSGERGYAEPGKVLWPIIKPIADFLWLDDAKAIINPNTSVMEKGLASIGFLPIGKIIKGPKYLTKISGKSEDILKHLAEKGLTPEQIKKYKKFVQARKGNPIVQIYSWPNGGKAFETVKMGKVPGSWAQYEQYINQEGKTILFGKRTYGPTGKFIHWHEAFPFNKLEILSEDNYIKRVQQLTKYENF